MHIFQFQFENLEGCLPFFENSSILGWVLTKCETWGDLSQAAEKQQYPIQIPALYYPLAV